MRQTLLYELTDFLFSASLGNELKQKKMKQFTNVNLHTGKLSQRWYISYKFLNPTTGKLERHREYGGVNRFDSEKSRLEALRHTMFARQRLLESGWSPYKPFNIEKIISPEEQFTIIESIDKVMENKKLYIKPTSYVSLKNRAENFKKFLKDNNYDHFKADEIKRKHIIAFIDQRVVQNDISNRTRNNYLIDVKSLFSKMIELELATINPCTAIKKVPVLTQKNKAFTNEEMVKINNWLCENDTYLQAFWRFIGYGFMRPIEITRLRIRDIKLDEGIIVLPPEIVKTNTGQHKLIFDVFRKHLEAMELHKYPDDYFVFSAKLTPNSKPTTRDFFTNRFKKLKDALGFTENHTMYALRHTVISNLMRNGADPLQIKQNTGHKTWGGFDAYIRSLNIDKPKDLSDKYGISF